MYLHLLATCRRREAYVFAKYFYYLFTSWFVPSSGGQDGTPGIFGSDLEISMALAGGCRADNV